MLLFSPVSCAIVARERGPRSTTCRSTMLRLCRRTARWLESSIAGFGVHMSGLSLSIAGRRGGPEDAAASDGRRRPRASSAHAEQHVDQQAGPGFSLK